MKAYTIEVTIYAADVDAATNARDLIAGVVEDIRDSGECKGLGDVITSELPSNYDSKRERTS